MTGARLVHDTLEQEGWSVEIADAQKVKGLAPLACKTDSPVARSPPEEEASVGARLPPTRDLAAALSCARYATAIRGMARVDDAACLPIVSGLDR
jgi:hypothetical protein